MSVSQRDDRVNDVWECDGRRATVKHVRADGTLECAVDNNGRLMTRYSILRGTASMLVKAGWSRVENQSNV